VRLMDVKTLSSLLSVKPKTIYDWVHKDYIPYIKLGRRLVRFDADEIRKWLENKKSKKRTAINL
jgi:excisionase family DNA binding protein